MQVQIGGQLYDRIMLVDALGNPLNLGGFQIQEVPNVTTGGSITPTNDANNRALIMHSAADLAAKDVVLPANMPNGGFLFVASDHTVASLTFSGATTIRGNPGMLTPYTFVKMLKINPTEWWCFD